jgi:DNA invertase Pin-like site-specific DNA recombinase
MPPVAIAITRSWPSARVRQSRRHLVVLSLGRLVRSLSPLLVVIEGLQARGAFFRSLRDPVDTASQPTGPTHAAGSGRRGRARIWERTRSGMRAAAARGKRASTPGLRSGDPVAIRKLSEARRAGHLSKLIAGAETWLLEVRRLRRRPLQSKSFS